MSADKVEVVSAKHSTIFRDSFDVLTGKLLLMLDVLAQFAVLSYLISRVKDTLIPFAIKKCDPYLSHLDEAYSDKTVAAFESYKTKALGLASEYTDRGMKAADKVKSALNKDRVLVCKRAAEEKAELVKNFALAEKSKLEADPKAYALSVAELAKAQAQVALAIALKKYEELKPVAIAKAIELKDAAIHYIESVYVHGFAKYQELKPLAIARVNEAKELALKRIEEAKPLLVQRLAEAKTLAAQKLEESKPIVLAKYAEVREQLLVRGSSFYAQAVETLEKDVKPYVARRVIEARAYLQKLYEQVRARVSLYLSSPAPAVAPAQ